MNYKLEKVENHSTVRNGQAKRFKENNQPFDDIFKLKEALEDVQKIPKQWVKFDSVKLFGD